jgi:hypothetical protein
MAAGSSGASWERDGQHDFDFLFGEWKSHHRRLRNPLTGSSEWAEFEGRCTAWPIWDGRGNIDEVEFRDPKGTILGFTLRLYDPKTRLWSIYWASAGGSTELGRPQIGRFEEGVGDFYNHEVLNGRAIFVRFAWSVQGPDACHWEQAFSADGGKNWEVNWVQDIVRESGPKSRPGVTG